MPRTMSPLLSADASRRRHDVSADGEGPPGDVATAARRDIGARIAWCVEMGREAPRIGVDTIALWELLAGTASADVTLARMLEPHLDALAILAQAGLDPAADDEAGFGIVYATTDSSWGVFAAEGSGMRLDARPAGSGWRLDGTKPWCSLAAHLSHALVTAHTEEGRRLFAVALRSDAVRPRSGPWLASGFADVVSAPVDFDGAVAVPVGEAGWYAERPGFAWGGMSVAACWWGGAVGVARAITDAAAAERADQVAFVHVGRVDSALWAARSCLREAAAIVDAQGRSPDAHPDDVAADEVSPGLLAARVRNVVADAATLTLSEADTALGPAPLVADADHSRRVADLHLYLRQHHGLRDLARTGRLVSAAEQPR